MTVEWSGLGPDVLLPLDRALPEPLRVQLENGLRDAIRGGRLAPGERLPSSRELARALAVSRGLVQDCYAQLQAEGYLVTRTGSATRVAEHTAPAAVAPAAPPARPAPRLVADFVPAVPDLAAFPRTDWAWAVRETCRTAPNSALDYGDPRGAEALRLVLSGYLRRVRGAAVDAAHLVVCNGFAQGLNLVLTTLEAAGARRVAFEDPGHDLREGIAPVWADRLDLVSVPVDEHGIDVDALRASGAHAVVLTPAHQWPTGVVLAPHRRHELVAWATTRHAWLIEDDYDAEFRYDRDPVGVLQGLAPDRTFTLGTVSKALAPALRLGWVVCPPAMTGPLAEIKTAGDRGSPGLEQLALACLVESGRYDRHLRRMRAEYAARREALTTAMARHAPAVRISGLAAGIHAVAHLPAGMTEPDTIAAARDRSVGLYGMSKQRSSQSPEPAQLILGFGAVNERAIHDGIAAIAPLFHPDMV